VRISLFGLRFVDLIQKRKNGTPFETFKPLAENQDT
jgi:hypothetical protein